MAAGRGAYLGKTVRFLRNQAALMGSLVFIMFQHNIQ